jgi:uncharacterized iron-regulated membrane protein
MTRRKVFFWLHLARADREYRYTPPSAGASRLAIEKVAALDAGFCCGCTIFVNPYTGVVLQTINPWRRWLALAGGNTAAGRAVTGACTLALLFLIASGFYLWFPWQHYPWANNLLYRLTGSEQPARASQRGCLLPRNLHCGAYYSF